VLFKVAIFGHDGLKIAGLLPLLIENVHNYCRLGMPVASRNNQIAPAHGDWLTGLPSRGDCLHHLASLLSRGDAERTTVFWINVDRFRQINRSFGHMVGDSVLVALARRLGQIQPAGAMLARMGGDEFVLSLGGIGEDEAKLLAESILSALVQPLGVGKHQLRPSVSLGVALSDRDDSASELLERADRLMQEAKRQGGGRYVVSEPIRHVERGGKVLAREELNVEEMLHRSLEYGGLYLDYQPIVRIPDRTPIAVEALMRCRVDDQIISPSRFIPVAEKTGLIMHLGDLSLVMAAGFVRRLGESGMEMKVAVNVSRAQLLNPGFAKSLHGVLALTGVAPSQLELEITESLFMDHSEVVNGNLHAAIQAGFSLALDDFGTGYSSLACLKTLPASKIKLDRAFVIDLPHDQRSFGVARAVARLAADLDITLVAEGVENEAQYNALQEAGVGAVQGYYIAHPMAEAAVQKWLQGES